MTPADGGTTYNRYVDVTGSIAGPRPRGPLWLVWAAQPKPTDPHPTNEYYAKGQIHPGAGGSFGFTDLTMGDTSTWSAGRTWRVFVAAAVTPAARAWLRSALANNGNSAWDGHRLVLPPGVRMLGAPVFVTRSS